MTKFFFNEPTVFATSIIVLTYLMPVNRRIFFLEWLCAHDARLACKKDDMSNPIHNALKNWFETLPPWEALQEYERVISEIVWWRDLKHETLMGMLEEPQAHKRKFF
jgi:hypothetical protein